jgi:hypothetical protein
MTERQTETAAMYRENELFAERESVETTRAYCAHLSCIADLCGGDAGFDMVDSMMDYLTDELFSRQHVADAWPEFAAWKQADTERRLRVQAESRKAVQP